MAEVEAVSALIEKTLLECVQAPWPLRGPLGSSSGYLNHIATKNCCAYLSAKKKHAEEANYTESAKYEELRLFLNAIESLNNVLDYFYFEHKDQLISRHSTVQSLRSAVHKQFAALQKLADLANAYKHCVRTSGKKKQTVLPNAKDLQRTLLKVVINCSDQSSPKVEVDYSFIWPIPENEKVLEDAMDFWGSYDQSLLLNAYLGLV